MAWRLARSLAVLRDEVRTVHPGTRVDTIGDEEHQEEDSDHNPNPAGVVCAADFFPGHGLKLARFAEQVRDPRHPAVKYVIFNRRIWSKARTAEGWRDYHGDDPHTGHVHVSVGVGPDGRSTGPYDNPAPWGLLEDDMQLNDQVTIPGWIKRRWKTDDGLKDGKIAVKSALGSGYGHSRAANEQSAKALKELTALRGEVAGLTALVQQLLAAGPSPVTPQQFTQLLEAVKQAAREPGEELVAALAAAGEALTDADDQD